ncbi:MAG: hypothetical protein GKR77_04010 [Legionellales bacterium]|nr:hypothetical protein [Legionellales bacterium]
MSGRGLRDAQSSTGTLAKYIRDATVYVSPNNIDSAIITSQEQLTELFCAIEAGDLLDISPIIESEMFFSDQKNEQGDTLLIAAIKALDEKEESDEKYSQRLKILTTLAAHSSIRFDTVDSKGNTALMVAVQSSSLQAVQLLLTKGRIKKTSITTCNNDGNTVLMLAIQQALSDDDAAANILKIVIGAINQNLSSDFLLLDELVVKSFESPESKQPNLDQLPEESDFPLLGEPVVKSFESSESKQPNLDQLPEESDFLLLDELVGELEVKSFESPESKQPIKTSDTKKTAIGGAAGATTSATAALVTFIVVTASSIPPVLFTLTVVGIAAASGFLIGAGITYAAIKIHCFFKERSVTDESVDHLLARQFDQVNEKYYHNQSLSLVNG